MSNILIRGLPDSVHSRIQKMAEAENLSINQLLVRLLNEIVGQKQTEAEKERQRLEAFQRLKELRERLGRKYGRSEDSAKLIREAREERTRRAENW